MATPARTSDTPFFPCANPDARMSVHEAEESFSQLVTVIQPTPHTPRRLSPCIGPDLAHLVQIVLRDRDFTQVLGSIKNARNSYTKFDCDLLQTKVFSYVCQHYVSQRDIQKAKKAFACIPDAGQHQLRERAELESWSDPASIAIALFEDPGQQPETPLSKSGQIWSSVDEFLRHFKKEPVHQVDLW